MKYLALASRVTRWRILSRFRNFRVRLHLSFIFVLLAAFTMWPLFYDSYLISLRSYDSFCTWLPVTQCFVIYCFKFLVLTWYKLDTKEWAFYFH